MRVPLCLLMVFVLWGPAAGGEDEPRDPLVAARDIGDYLVATARREGKAVHWAQYEGSGPDAQGEARHFPVALYAGTAGTGTFLLGLGKATGEARYLRAAEGAGRYLLRAARPDGRGGLTWEATSERRGRSVPEGRGPGLYVGSAGIGLFLAQLGEPEFAKGAEAAFQPLLDPSRVRSGRDVISGEAGIGLALLAMHRLTKDARYRTAARASAAWLASGPEPESGHDPAFSHGVAGVAFFLRAEGEADAAREAARWIADRPSPWHYYGGAPPEGKRDWFMNSWCHGPAGTTRPFLLLHRADGDASALATAVEGGRAMLAASPPPNATWCCGEAGVLAALLDLHAATGEASWLVAAGRSVARILDELEDVDGHRVLALYDDEDAAHAHPYVPTGFMQGNAGIGYALLRLALQREGREDVLLRLPDQPAYWSWR